MLTLRAPARLPLGILPLLIPGALIVATTTLLSRPSWFWNFYEWQQVSQQFHEQLVLAGPIAAAGATYYAGRLFAADRVYAQAWSPRSGYPALVRAYTTFAGTLTVSYLLAFLPLLVIASTRSEVGGPDFRVILTGVLGLVALTAMGFAVGVISGSAWLAPLVLVLSFILMQSSATNHALAAIDPVTHVIAPLGHAETGAIVFYRAAFFVLVTFASMVIAARALARRNRWKVPSPQTVAMVAFLFVGVLVPLRWPPAVMAEELNPPAVCVVDEQIQYCVHAGHRSQLPIMTDAARNLLRLSGPMRSTVHRVRDAALATPGDDTRSDDTIWIHLYPEDSTTQASLDAVANAVSGEDACGRRYGVTPQLSESETLSLELKSALVQSAGGTAGTPTTRFGQLRASDFTAWIAAHQDAIATCSLNESQMP
jgi:hypothetical protein